jgi:hypothetical protein
MPHFVYHGFHQFSHSDFHYKTPDLDDPRAIKKSWLIKTNENVQFAESVGYKDSMVVKQFKKIIPGFENARCVDEIPLKEQTIMDKVGDGFRRAGLL